MPHSQSTAIMSHIDAKEPEQYTIVLDTLHFKQQQQCFRLVYYFSFFFLLDLQSYMKSTSGSLYLRLQVKL